MLFSQFLSAALFYFVFFLFGGIGLWITAKLISDKMLAYVSAKIAGLVVFGYGIWILSSFRVLDYQNKTLISVLFILCALAGWYMSRGFFAAPAKDGGEEKRTETKRRKKRKKAAGDANTNAKKEWSFAKKALLLEAAAFCAYLAYLYLRSYHASINGTERFMDMAMLTAAGKTNYFPFIDPWYAGKTINYYYYGSYLMSAISNLARLPYALTYNFSLGLLFSQTVLLSSVFTYVLSKSKKAAVMAAFFITMAGTLFFAGCSVFSLLGPNGALCRYTSSARLFSPSYIINEVPSYSFTVGDLHPHLLALPFFIFCLVLLYALAESKKFRAPLFVAIALGIATLGLMHTWDAITLVCVFFVILLIRIFFAVKRRGDPMGWETWRHCVLGGVGTVLFAVLFMAPHFAYFDGGVLGVGFSPSYVALHQLKDVQYPTPISALAGIWGIFMLGAALFFFSERTTAKGWVFISALLIVSFGILAGVELFFIRDIYSVANPPFFRANTTFKFGSRAWVMLAIVFGVFMAHLLRAQSGAKKRVVRACAVVLCGIAIAAGSLYPYAAIKQFFFAEGDMGGATLDGEKWIKDFLPGDWSVIRHINDTFSERKVIAEAVGDSYSNYSRIATFTGMIAPMGWKTHEWSWRLDGSRVKEAPPSVPVETGWGAVERVAGDVRLLYETEDSAEARRIIKQYGIEYVYAGDMERAAYPALREEKFYRMGKVEFMSGKNILFDVSAL